MNEIEERNMALILWLSALARQWKLPLRQRRYLLHRGGGLEKPSRSFYENLSRLDGASFFRQLQKKARSWQLPCETMDEELELRFFEKSKQRYRLKAEAFCREGIRVTAAGHPPWPRLLNSIKDPPAWLWYKGAIPSSWDELAPVAVVGSRRMSAYGAKVCAEIVAWLCDRGHPLISGLAVGIDGQAHRRCLHEGGRTAAVLPSALDRIYPATHKDLSEEICQKGFLVSEYEPGTEVKRKAFAARNRLISGLSIAVIVAEAAERSGSLMTAGCAAEQGRDVYAVPGSLYMEGQQGCLALIRDGASLLDRVERLDALPLPLSREAKSWADADSGSYADFIDDAEEKGALEGERGEDVKERILAQLHSCPSDLDGTADSLSMGTMEMAARLSDLEFYGLICRSRGKFILTEKGISCIYES